MSKNRPGRLGASGKAVSSASALASQGHKNVNQKQTIKGRSGQRRRGTNTTKKG